MTENVVVIASRREQVFALFAEPRRYAEWLFGTDEVRDADESWPEPGSRLHHSIGAGPATIDDFSEVLECEAPERLVLLAHVGPLGSFRVELLLHEEGSSTRVTMREAPVEGASTLGGPITSTTLSIRNHLSLERLKELGETSGRPDRE